jgi:signal transduction histidine kinase
MGRRLSRLGIRTRFILTVSTLIVLACLTLSIFFINHERNTAKEVLKSQGLELSSDLARQVQTVTPGADPAYLRPIVDRCAQQKGVVYCAIKDGQGRILAEARNSGYTSESEQTVTFAHPISGPGTGESDETESVATAWVVLSSAQWTNKIVSLKRNAIFLALVVVALGILATLLVVQVTVNPIRKLVDATQRIARGELNNPVKIVSSGEIGDLSEALNDMAFRLQQSHSQLEEYSKTLEKKVEQRTEELEERVKELSDSRMATINILEDVKEAKTELERVNEELRALDEMKSKFIGTISHELKTPFTAIKANVDFIVSGKEGEVPENLFHYLQTIQRNTNRVQKIMEDFLLAAQIRSGKRQLEPEEVKLGSAVQEYLDEIGPMDKKFTVKLNIPKGILVFADRNRLHDVYVNLLSNALKFSPNGGEIRITARPHNGHVLSEVSDQGVGIPKDKLEAIFDEFFQVDRKKFGGTGLGLSIVRGIIQEHGGKIWVDSQLGEGSTFFFTLPVGKVSKDGPIRQSDEGSDR